MIRRPPRSTLFPYNDALPIYLVHAFDDKDIAASLQCLAGRVALQRAYLLDEDELLVRWPGNVVYVRVIAMHHFAARKTGIAGIQRCNVRVWSTCAEQGLAETPGQ